MQMEIEIEIRGPIVPLSRLCQEIEFSASLLERFKDPVDRSYERVRILLPPSAGELLDGKLRVISDAVDRMEHEFPDAVLDLRVRELTKSEPPAGTENFLKPFHPLLSLSIVPWHWTSPDPADTHIIRLGPHDAFGTGRHPSTRLCLQCMEEIFGKRESVVHQGKVLDFGCGSGILAMAALKMGAGQVLGVELDAQAVEAARYNAKINGLSDRLKVQQGPCRCPADSFDLVLANLVPSVLSRLASQIAGYLKQTGIMIISGFGTEQKERMTSMLTGAGLKPSGARSLEGWCALIFGK